MNKPYIPRNEVSFDKQPLHEDSNKIYLYYSVDRVEEDIRKHAYTFLGEATVYDNDELAEQMLKVPITAVSMCYFQGNLDEVVFITRVFSATLH